MCEKCDLLKENIEGAELRGNLDECVDYPDSYQKLLIPFVEFLVLLSKLRKQCDAQRYELHYDKNVPNISDTFRSDLIFYWTLRGQCRPDS